MTLKEGFAEIKKLLSLKFEDAAPVTDAAPDPALTDYPLADGTVLSIDVVAVGGVVTVAGVPVVDGEYELPDGTNITTVSGIITECESKEVEDAEKAEEEQALADLKNGDMGKVKSDIEAMAAEIIATRAGYASQKKENKTLHTALVKLSAMVEQIGEGLVSNPIEKQEPAVLTAFQKHNLKNAKNV